VTGVALNALNTLAVPARAREVLCITRVAELEALSPRLREGRALVLGGGSNVLLAERIEQTICLIRLRGVRAVEANGHLEVTAAAGENWHGLVRWSLGQGLAGLENLALIPGSVGAAPVQNIGAYGVELDSLFVRLTALDTRRGRLVTIERQDCGFGYRTSRFKHDRRYVITDVTLSLSRNAPVRTDYADVAEELERLGRRSPRPVDVAEAVVRIRRRKLPDPRRVPNAGSFFKNPVVDEGTWRRLRESYPGLKHYAAPDGVKLAAAQLIDLSGFQPTPAAPVSVWPRQSLVVINPGRRPIGEVLAFAEQLRGAVRARFGVRLEIEPDAIGF
jgi:UDP-N-acetylmuramate dehydrogenase